jgi:hypothetical protein
MLFGVFQSADAATEKTQVLPVSAQATGIPRRTFVDPALALDEDPQRLIQALEFGRVPQHPRPLAPRPLIDLATISRAKNHSSKWFRLPNRRIPPQVQCPMSALNCSTLMCPPRDGFENSGQVSIDRIPVPGWFEPFPTHFVFGADWLPTLRLKKGWRSVRGRAWLDILKVALGI